VSASPIGARAGVPLIVAAPFRGLSAKPDKRLVELAQRGDTHAIEILYDRYATAILRYCRSLLRSTQEAEDVQQEVFVTALSALRNGAGPDSFRPWLYRVAHNACISHMRAKRPALAAVDGELVASATTEPASEEREELRQLLDDLGALPAVQRGALLLREMDGFSYEQVGEVLGLPVTTVRSTIFRARSTLQGLAEARDAKCEEIQTELSELADRRGRRSRRITSHLRVCSECRDFRTQLRNRPAVLRGYVPALPIGVLATVKAATLGAPGTAGGATAGAAAGASGGVGLLGGAGAGKMVAAAASACALIGGAGTQVGVLGGGDGANRSTSAAVAGPHAIRTDDERGSRRSQSSSAGSTAATTARSGVVPLPVDGATSYEAPGTVVWRPAGENRKADGHAAAGTGEVNKAVPASYINATTGSRPRPSTMSQWSHARPGAMPWWDDGEPDDNSDDGPAGPVVTGSPAPPGDDDQSVRRPSDRSDRDGSTTATMTGTTTSSQDSSRDDGSRRETEDSRDAGGDQRTPSSDGPAPAPAQAPAEEQHAVESGTSTPPSDAAPSDAAPTAPAPAPDTTAKEPAPSSPPAGGGSTTTTTPSDPAPGSTTTSTTSTDPDPAPDPAPTTP
jgi:RNA polymerase sigma factor (sigma-70 family)